MHTFLKHTKSIKRVYTNKNIRKKDKEKEQKGSHSKESTLIDQPNSLTIVPSRVANCRNLPFSGKVTRGLTGASSKERKRAESPPTFIRGKCRKNQKRRGLRTLSMKGSQVVFTHMEGISTPHFRHKGRQPLIKCANMTSRCFPFFMSFCVFMLFIFFIFLWSTRVFPSLLRILNCDEEIKPTQFFFIK